MRCRMGTAERQSSRRRICSEPRTIETAQFVSSNKSSRVGVGQGSVAVRFIHDYLYLPVSSLAHQQEP